MVRTIPVVFAEKAAAVARALADLSLFWEESGLDGHDPRLCEHYPFRESLDEVTAAAREWAEDLRHHADGENV